MELLAEIGKHLLAVGLGWLIGITFPDIDLAPPLPIKHRSAWTHGPLVPIAVYFLIAGNDAWRWFAIGFLPAFIIHLVYDLFPKRWHGGAKISLYPIPGRLPAFFSFLFLASGVFTAGVITFSLINGKL